MKKSLSQHFYLFTFFLLDSLFVVRIAEYVLAYVFGDQDGKIETAFIVYSFRATYILLGACLLFLILRRLFMIPAVATKWSAYKEQIYANISLFSWNDLCEFLIPIVIILFPLIQFGFNFDLESGIKHYWQFSNELFQPQNQYFQESILAPLFAWLIGANGSLLTYEIFSIALSFIWLSLLHVFLKHAGVRASQRLAILAVMSTNTTLCANLSLIGYPDPLTAIGITMMLLGGSYPVVFFGGIIAALSHFSIAVFAALNVIIIRAFASNFDENKIKLRAFIATSVLGIGAGRILLQVWYYIFGYNLHSRIDWVINKGIDYWIQFNLDHLHDFANLQNISHFILIAVILIVFLSIREKFSLAILLGIANALAAFFITVDRPRIFVQIYWVILVYALIEVFRNPKVQERSKRIVTAIIGLGVLLDVFVPMAIRLFAVS